MNRPFKAPLTVMAVSALLIGASLIWVTLDALRGYGSRLDDLAERVDDARAAMSKDEGCYSTDVPCPRLASGTIHVEVCCKEGESAEHCLARFDERVLGAEVWCAQ